MIENKPDKKTSELKTILVNLDDETKSYKVFKHHLKKPHFNFLFRVKKSWQKYLIVTILAIISSFEIIFLVKNSGIYPSGLRSVTQGIAFLSMKIARNAGLTEQNAITIYNVLFWVLYAILNIPLYFIAQKFVGKKFANMGCYYIIFCSLLGFILSEWATDLIHVNVFGSTTPMGRGADDDGNIFNSTNKFIQSGVFILPFWYPTTDKNIFDVNNDSYRALQLLVYGLAHGFFAALINSWLYNLGTSAGGTDFIAFSYANKGKNLSKMMFNFGIISLAISYLIGTYIPAGLTDKAGWGYEFLFSANIVASYIALLVYRLFISRFFPNQRHMKVEIYSEKINDIAALLNKKGYHREIAEIKVEVYNKTKPLFKIETICNITELDLISSVARAIDSKCFIVCISVNSIDGYMLEKRYGDDPLNTHGPKTI